MKNNQVHCIQKVLIHFNERFLSALCVCRVCINWVMKNVFLTLSKKT